MAYWTSTPQPPALWKRGSFCVGLVSAGICFIRAGLEPAGRHFRGLGKSTGSRRARADLLKDVDPATCRILVLGDDDLLSVELAQRGFRHVTVADCDPRLLARIRAETAALATPPEIVEADFHAGLGWKGQADVIFLDPPYSVAGAEAFLKLTIGCAAPLSHFYLMINPFVVGSNFSHVIALAVHSGFHCTIAATGGTTGMAGCGQLQYMCVRESDGSPVPDDGTGLN